MMTSEITKWSAVLLAGQRPGVDPLAKAFDQTYKALIPVDGIAMVTRVATTLLSVPHIERVIVMAQDPAALLPALPSDPRLTVTISNAGISTSVRAVAGSETAPWPVFVTTADHPLLTREMIEVFLAGAGESDLAIGMVERDVILSAYPENKRTWLRFSDGHWSGANLFALRTASTHAALDLWAEAEQDRKKAWKLFLHFGPWLALRAITRTIGLAKGLERAGKRFGFSAKLVPLPFAEAAIDVDKVTDHQQVEQILREQKT
jgi:CTP:molybdopterin cytidylyltransferase MocA